MRIFLLILVFSYFKCAGQQNDTLYFIKYTPTSFGLHKEVVTVLPSDTAYSRIDFSDTTIKVKLKNEWASLKDYRELEIFIKEKKTLMGERKILITCFGVTDFNRFGPIYKLLKKYNLLNFELIDKDFIKETPNVRET